ncbi:MAG: M1 family metallopeptidase [Planctomycetes bacterium]|nr:M1 family metallopeptidase [Planctomycetota bacterium]
MLNRHFLRFFLLFVFILGGSTLSKGKAFAESIESDLQNRLRVHYAIECSIDDNGQLLEGNEVISFKNSTSDPIGQIAIKWLRQGGETLKVTSNGKDVSFLTDVKSSRVIFKLPEAIKPGGNGIIEIKFGGVKPAQSLNNKIGFAAWHPQLNWGLQRHADFDVKINAPSKYAILTSGFFNESVGRYQVKGVRSFLVILCNEHKVMEANAEDVLVRCAYTPESEECARLIVKTAVDAINFYRKHFGFYPYRILTIVPGMDNPAGGYPVAPCVVAIHGMEKFDSRPKNHWQWITAHEIGHQYCGEYILSDDTTDPFNWLMIGLGIYADREYSQARNLSSEKHRGLMDRYIGGVRDGLDTTINITPEQRSKIKFDFNNVVKHGKSYSVISALDCVLGKETFSRIYRRCLKEFGGRRLGVLEFQAVCEEEAGQDLGWFFEQWVNSNKHLSYKISSQKCQKKDNSYISRVEVKCIGDLKMPVPVTVYFADGSSQTRFTNRLTDINVLEFKSKSPLKKALLDSKEALAFALPQ